MQKRFVLNSHKQPRSQLRAMLTWIISLSLFALLLMFSVVVLAVIALVGIIAFVYIWWKTREVRKQMRIMRSVATPETRREAQASNDSVFEGEVIRVVAPKEVT